MKQTQNMTQAQTWRLLTPVSLRSRVCRNRIVVGAHSYGYVDAEGLPSDRLTDYLVERAKGGAGLIIMGGTSVSREGALIERISMNVDDRIIPRYREISNGVHGYGALILDQLAHVGGQVDSVEGHVVVAPSAIPHEICRGVPAELTLGEIQDIKQKFVQAARRAWLGGLDGIEVKCDQGFLIHQFLSPYYNRRDDEYGGELGNRVRFLVEVLEGVRAVTAQSFIVGVRITGDSFAPNDLSLSSSIEVIKYLEPLSLLDYVHINGGTNSTYPGYLLGHGDSSVPNLNLLPTVKGIRQAVRLPLIAASMITSPEEAEEIIRSNAADLVAMTRPHIADAEIVNKIRENRLEDIRPCIYCNQSCVGNHWKGADIRCIHNPATGRERELGIGTIRLAEKQKSFLVVGGGVAGLEFARVAAMRGHKVELFEEQKEVGGQVLLAAMAPYRQGFLDVARYLEKQATKSGVLIRKGIRVTGNDILLIEAEYSGIVLATGAAPYIPPIWDKVEREKMLTPWDLRDTNGALGRNIIIVDMDWRHNALSIAELLVARGCNVLVISTAFIVGEGLDGSSLTSHYSRLEGNVKLLPLTALESLDGQVARLRHILSNRVTEVAPVDHIMVVGVSRPQNDLYLELAEISDKVTTIGDCRKPMGVPEAILAATELARSL